MKSAAVFVLVLALWVVGLLAFASRVADMTPAPDPPPADGVVALTGGSTMRLTTAVHLLEIGLAQRALISGVNQKASRADIRGVSRATRRYYDCCVDLGFSAQDTVGNARETAAWTKAHHFRSLIVVTADFHMPRAMIELGAAMPGVALRAYPVKTDYVDAARWWRTRDGARHLVVEYTKYVAVLARQAMLNLGPKERRGAAVLSGAKG